MSFKKKAKAYMKKSINPVIHGMYRFLVNSRDFIFRIGSMLLFKCFGLLKRRDKVIASTFLGKKFGDNTQYILEELHSMNADLDIVWVADERYSYSVPEWVRTIPRQNRIRRVYEYATAKVWIDTHRLGRFYIKKPDQLFIETWHGGLGIKKLDGDVPKFRKMSKLMAEVNNTAKYADFFVSNSNHLTSIYRSAFLYEGKIWKCGYPKNDILINGKPGCREKLCNHYGIRSDANILIYAPTFRDSFTSKGFVKEVYDIDFDLLRNTIMESWGGQWVIMLRWHPVMVNSMKKLELTYGEGILDVTDYPDMQELILSANVFLSDYSSCIFDAALRGIPCFTFATDFEEYKGDRGVYYEMEELPFPYARNNQELMENIRFFDPDAYQKRWEAFKIRTGLYETGHAAKDIAYVINAFIKGDRVPLEEIQSE